MVALEILSLQHDEVLVKGLEGGVGEAGGAVEDGSADKQHVEPLDERAGRETVEEGFLVEATLVEIFRGEGC